MIRLIFAGLFLVLGLFMFVSEVLGFYKFTYVMNRMHAAALGDTLGISASIKSARITSAPVKSLSSIRLPPPSAPS